jgi:2,4-dienoyl-CoA reductase (NADPH2)
MLSSGDQTLRNYLLFHLSLLRPLFRFLWDRVPNRLFHKPNVLPGERLNAAMLADDFLAAVNLERMQQLLDRFQGRNLSYAKAIRDAVDIPVICTGGFQQASLINEAIEAGYCDAVSMARMLVANNDLVQQFQAGADVPVRPCT